MVPTGVMGGQLIVAWGDSLTEGVCTHGYPEQLENQLGAAGRPATLVNCGLGGEVSKDSLTRLKQTLLCDAIGASRGYCVVGEQYIWGSCEGRLWSRKGWYTYLNGQQPDFMLIWIGANDEIHRIDYHTTIFNLQEMIQVAKEYRITPLVATLTPDYKYDMQDCTSGRLADFNSLVAEAASEQEVNLADQCRRANSDWPWINCGDGLHPNEQGNRDYIAPTWLAVLPARSQYKVVMNGPFLLLLAP